jgi:hypothetical protein
LSYDLLYTGAAELLQAQIYERKGDGPGERSSTTPVSSSCGGIPIRRFSRCCGSRGMRWRGWAEWVRVGTYTLREQLFDSLDRAENFRSTQRRFTGQIGDIGEGAFGSDRPLL